MDPCLANPSPSIILISEEESREWGKLNATAVSRHPNNSNASQLLSLYDSNEMESCSDKFYILDVQYASHQKGFAICVLKYSAFLPGKEKSLSTKPIDTILLYTFPLYLTCNGLRYTGLLWLSKEKGSNLPKNAPEPTIILAARKTGKKRYYKIIKD